MFSSAGQPAAALLTLQRGKSVSGDIETGRPVCRGRGGGAGRPAYGARGALHVTAGLSNSALPALVSPQGPDCPLLPRATRPGLLQFVT